MPSLYPRTDRGRAQPCCVRPIAGVRVRVLIDDGDTDAGDEQIIALDAHQVIEIRIFNPFAYRGHIGPLRIGEFLLNASRFDYRMRNKLLVVDNAVALIGARNIGNQYFQVDPESHFADDDVFAARPIARQLSATFDEYWNSRFAIPAEALGRNKRTPAVLAGHRERASEPPEQHADYGRYRLRQADREPGNRMPA